MTLLKAADGKELQHYDGGILSPGDALWIPAGHVPLWVGLPQALSLKSAKVKLAERGKQSQGTKRLDFVFDEFATVAIYLAYEIDSHCFISSEVTSRLAGNYLCAKAFPGAVGQLPKLSKWIKQCTPDYVPAAPGGE